MRYVKPGMEEEELRRDLAWCTEIARSRASHDMLLFESRQPLRKGPVLSREGYVSRDLIPSRVELEQRHLRSCMARKGYKLSAQ